MSEKRSKVVIERTYRAQATELWDLWTTKEGFESWWGPEGFRVEVHALEARVGGALRYDMIADAPEQIEAMRQLGRPAAHETRGRFAEMRPHQRLAITLDPMHNEEFTKMSTMGMTSQLTKLDRRFGGRRGARSPSRPPCAAVYDLTDA